MLSELLGRYIITRMHISHSTTPFFASLCWRPFLPNKKSGCIWSTRLRMSGSDEFIAYTIKDLCFTLEHSSFKHYPTILVQIKQEAQQHGTMQDHDLLDNSCRRAYSSRMHENQCNPET